MHRSQHRSQPLVACPSPVRHLYLWINSDIQSWYLGTDGRPAPAQTDLVTTVLHELCHGFGLGSSVAVDDATGLASTIGVSRFGIVVGRPANSFPLVFDTLLRVGRSPSRALVAIPDGQTRADAVTSDDLWASLDDDAGVLVKVFAPPIFQPGHSASHLDGRFVDGHEALLAAERPSDKAVHSLGPLSLCLLERLGWTVPLDCSTLGRSPLAMDGAAIASHHQGLGGGRGFGDGDGCAEVDRSSCDVEMCCIGSTPELRLLVQRALCASTCCLVPCVTDPPTTAAPAPPTFSAAPITAVPSGAPTSVPTGGPTTVLSMEPQRPTVRRWEFLP